MGRVPREQKMLKEHLPRVIYHQVFGGSGFKFGVKNVPCWSASRLLIGGGLDFRAGGVGWREVECIYGLQIHMKRELNQNLSGNEDYCTKSSTSLVKKCSVVNFSDRKVLI